VGVGVGEWAQPPPQPMGSAWVTLGWFGRRIAVPISTATSSIFIRFAIVISLLSI
jgi:hypothetical protein